MRVKPSQISFMFCMIWDEDKIQFQADGIDTVSVNLWGSLKKLIVTRSI